MPFHSFPPLPNFSSTPDASHMSSQESLHRQYFQRLFNLTTTSPPQCGEYQGPHPSIPASSPSLPHSSLKGWTTYETKSYQLDGGNYQYEEEIISLIGTHYTDYPMGRDFFHSFYRMHKDALADGAKKALDEIFGPLESVSDDEDDQNEEKSSNDDSQEIPRVYLGFLGILFIPGLMIGFYLGSRGKGGQGGGRGNKAEKEIDITRSTSTNVIHEPVGKDVEGS
jgi:hypothetical protein